jgi:hypothetical protein
MSRYPADLTPSSINSGDGPYFLGDDREVYRHYYMRLLAIATTRYRWLGLGAWIDPQRLEYLLVTKGLAAFTYVRQAEDLPEFTTEARTDYYTGQLQAERTQIESDRFTVTHATVTGYLDDTFTPAGYRTYAPNGAGGVNFRTTDKLEKWKGVPIWGDSNRSMYDAETIALFARRLASAALVVDTNLKMTMRGPVVVSTQDQLQTKRVALDGAMRGIDVFVANAETIESMKALDFGVHPDTVESSHRVNMRLWAEALEALGVESPAAEKRERMIVDEVNGDASQIAAIRRLTLTPRKRSAELINRRYFEGEPVVEVVDQW